MLPAARLRQKPIAGIGEKIFCHAAVNVTATSQARGTQVIHRYFAPCILSRMVVATHSAMAASNWLAVPYSGHSELIPPADRARLESGSSPTPPRSPRWSPPRRHPTCPAQRFPDVPQEVLQHEPAHARAGVEDGQDKERLEHDGEVVPEADQRPSAAGGRKNVGHSQRQRRGAAGAVEQGPLAHFAARLVISATVTGKPHDEMVATAAAGVAPTVAAGEFTAKYTPGCSTQAAIMAIMATKLSSAIEP